MKITSLSCAQGGERSGVLELPRRWGVGFLGQRRAASSTIGGRTIEFRLDRNSLWSIAGSVRGVRIDCRHGRLWLTQAGAPADVILQPGQSFVADAGGAIVVQFVPEFNASVEAAVATLTVNTGSAARLKIHPRSAGAGAADRDRIGMWEQLAFIALGLCGGFSVWYCLKTGLSLTWPQ
jgi:hypothetical protein